jgi:hypothetical protein
MTAHDADAYPGTGLTYTYKLYAAGSTTVLTTSASSSNVCKKCQVDYPDRTVNYLPLLALVPGESTDQEIAHLGRDLPAECRAAAVPGLWLLYSEVFAFRSRGAASNAYEILTLIEPDQGRVASVYEIVGADLGISSDGRPKAIG